MASARWFARQPESVTVFRDSDGSVTGFSCVITLRAEDSDLIDSDPGASTAWRWVQSQPVGKSPLPSV